MKISYNWLKDFLQFEESPEALADILTSIGLEVEGLDKWQSVKGGLHGVVVGEVLTCQKHPNADKLSVTTVNLGVGEPVQIVCGAPNVAAGQKVAVATVGTTLYSGKESFEIKKAKIRGEESHGMICAEDELGLGTSHDGIMTLKPETVPGTLASEYFQVVQDYVFEIGLTPNRIDSASHFGVARDLAAYFAKTSKRELCKPHVDPFAVDNHNLKVDIIIENSEACPRYSGISITGAKVAPSPKWLQNRLKAIGLNPINNVVDVTNYVLHEMGHPLHAFDADKLAGKKIVVKQLEEGTPFITLDEEERKLSAEDLMICDGDGPVAIAGVFGGLGSGVTTSTTNIFLESAYFNPVYVRKTAKRHNLSTDASFRFERGADEHHTIYALKRAANLIKEIAGGKISSEIIDNYPLPSPKLRVDVKISHVNRLIGKNIPLNEIKTILEGLEINILKEDGDNMLLEIPKYRVDVEREADVIEEILRIYGYNNVEIGEQLRASLNYKEKPDKEQILERLSNYLTSNGFNEIMCTSLTRSGYYKELKYYPAEKLVRMLNPVSIDLDVMRQTLLFGGLETISYNKNRQQNNLHLFEIGNCYALKPGIKDVKSLEAYVEEEKIMLAITGNKTNENWTSTPQKSTYFYLKAYVENLLESCGYNIQNLDLKPLEMDIYDEGFGMLEKDVEIAHLGIVHADICSRFDIDEPVNFAEISIDALLNKVKKNVVEFTEISKFPEVRRDLALLIDKSVSFAEIKALAFKTEQNILQHVDLFDVYTGKNIPEDKKSYGVAFILQDKNKTLSDKQIDKTMSRLQEVYKNNLNASIR